MINRDTASVPRLLAEIVDEANKPLGSGVTDTSWGKDNS